MTKKLNWLKKKKEKECCMSWFSRGPFQWWMNPFIAPYDSLDPFGCPFFFFATHCNSKFEFGLWPIWCNPFCFMCDCTVRSQPFLAFFWLLLFCIWPLKSEYFYFSIDIQKIYIQFSVAMWIEAWILMLDDFAKSRKIITYHVMCL